ncbi:BhlA/UviB family holin-like peptide [uncultured Clostridium sp.]
MEDFIKLASTQGIWSALSIVLIFYILKMQEKRYLKKEVGNWQVD